MLLRLSEHLAVAAVSYNNLWNVQPKAGNAVKTVKSFDMQVMKQETNANVLPTLQETDDCLFNFSDFSLQKSEQIERFV